MRVGLSWDADRFESAATGWEAIVAEAQAADRMGFQSFWIREGREATTDCSAPSIFLTYLSQKTKSAQLRIGARRVTRALPAHIAEEVAVLDTFARGRAGLAFAPASPPGRSRRSRPRDDRVRHRGMGGRRNPLPRRVTPLSVPHARRRRRVGASTPEAEGAYVPQWEWGPETPDFLSITPKPYVAHTPVNVEIDDDETLDWAARTGISPMVGADAPDRTRPRSGWRATGASRMRPGARAARSRRCSSAASRSTATGRRADPRRLSPRRAECDPRAARTHRRSRISCGGATAPLPMDLYRFASEVQLLLQA